MIFESMDQIKNYAIIFINIIFYINHKQLPSLNSK